MELGFPLLLRFDNWVILMEAEEGEEGEDGG